MANICFTRDQAQINRDQPSRSRNRPALIMNNIHLFTKMNFYVSQKEALITLVTARVFLCQDACKALHSGTPKLQQI